MNTHIKNDIPIRFLQRFGTEAQRRGASAILIVFMFAALVMLAFLGINVSLLQRHHAEAQIASDLAARRGVDLLAQGIEEIEIDPLVRDAAELNWPTFLQSGTSFPEIEVEFGNSVVANSQYLFTAGVTPTNSVRVEIGRDVGTVGPLRRVTQQVSVTRDATAAALERDVCLVIDRSGSMTFDLVTGTWMQDSTQHPYNAMSNSPNYWIRNKSYQWWWFWAHPQNSRWSSMLPAVYLLADELLATNQKEKFSIVSYSSDYDPTIYDHDLNQTTFNVETSSVIFEPTFDYVAAVTHMDNFYRYQMPIAGGTNISAGIDQAVEVLTGPDARPHAFKVMIVMTDGQFNQGRKPWLASADAATAGIEVHTVTFSNQANQQDMVATATAGRGIHFHAPDGDTLADIFQEIAHLPAAAIIE